MAMQIISIEVASQLNDRPIGRHQTHSDDGFSLSPYYLLLGGTQNQTVPFPANSGCNLTRHTLVENVLEEMGKQFSATDLFLQ